MTAASDLRTLVTVQQPTSGADELGQPLAGWSELMKLRADVRHPSGTATIKGDAVASAVRASARVRRRRDVTPAMRLLIDGAAYDIKAVVPVDDGRVWMDLVCEAVS